MNNSDRNGGDVDEEANSPYSIRNEDLVKGKIKIKDIGTLCPQICASFVAFLAALSFGNALGWSSPVAANMGDFAMAQSNFAMMVSMVPLGCTLGTIKCNYIMMRLGPKRTLQLVAIPYVLLWWVILLTHNQSIQWLPRLLLGSLCISYFISGACFLKQTVHYALSKYIDIGFSSAILLGVFEAHLLGYGFNTMIMTVVCSLTPAIHLGLLYLLPESPVFLYATSQAAALRSLTWYRGKDYVYQDLEMIKVYWENSRIDPDTYSYMFYSKVVFKAILIIWGLMVVYVFSGYFIILLYGIHVWNYAEVAISKSTDGILVSSFFVSSKVIWSVVHMHVIPHWRVKPLLISSCGIISVSYVLLTVFMYYVYVGAAWVQTFRWFPLLIIGVMIFAVDMSFSKHIPTLIVEYMPFQVFRMMLMFSQTAFWFLIFINSFCFSSLMTEKPFVVFAIIASITLVATMAGAYFVVEPVGKSLIQIQTELKGNPVGNRGSMGTRKMMEHQANLGI